MGGEDGMGLEQENHFPAGEGWERRMGWSLEQEKPFLGGEEEEDGMCLEQENPFPAAQGWEKRMGWSLEQQDWAGGKSSLHPVWVWKKRMGWVWSRGIVSLLPRDGRGG